MGLFKEVVNYEEAFLVREINERCVTQTNGEVGKEILRSSYYVLL